MHSGAMHTAMYVGAACHPCQRVTGIANIAMYVQDMSSSGAEIRMKQPDMTCDV